MKTIVSISIFFMVSILYAEPPNAVKEPAIDENFEAVFKQMQDHKHNEGESSRLNDVLPESSDTYKLGSPELPWAQVHAGTGTFSAAVGIGTTEPAYAFEVKEGTATATNGNFFVDKSTFGYVLRSPDDSCWRIEVSDAGVVKAAGLACP